MSTDLFRRILDEHEELSSLPQTLAEVLRVARDENASAQGLAEVLRRDPSLTVKILRVVNSPFYGANTEITSMTQAVLTLGIRAVTAIALSTSIYDLTAKWQTAMDPLRFWRHSLEVAVGSRMIAEEVGYPIAEEAFVSGLLHDIGLLVLEKSFPKEFSRIWAAAQSTGEAFEREREVWGTDHARVAQFLLEQWNLPRTICEAVGCHHSDFDRGDTEDSQRLSQMVALADTIAHFTVLPTRTASVPAMDRKESLATELGLRPESLRLIEEKHLGQTLDEAKFLEIDIGSHSDLLTEANRMLYQQYGALESLLQENRQIQKHLALAELDKAALDTLRTIAATFNHYINNAVGSILGRAQLVELALKRGDIVDHEDITARAMQIIISGVSTIQAVVEELTQLTTFRTTVYHDDTHIIDIDTRLKKKLDDLEQKSPATR